MFAGQSIGCRGLRSPVSSVCYPCCGAAHRSPQLISFRVHNLVGTASTADDYAPKGPSGCAWSSVQGAAEALPLLGGVDGGGAGHNSTHGGGSGGGGGRSNNNGKDNNNNNNNNNRGGRGGGDSFDDHLRRCSGPALLGALALIAASVAFPPFSRASPVSLSGALHAAADSIGGLFGGSDPSGKAARISSFTPTCGSSGGGGLSDSLERSSLGFNGGGRSPTSATSAFSTASSCASFPSRPRSKVLHVPCKGSTLVVPLRDAPDDAAAQPRSRGPWSRARVVEAPIALSGREVALLDHRQYRVRESMRV